jgi:hypothetical protein
VLNSFEKIRLILPSKSIVAEAVKAGIQDPELYVNPILHSQNPFDAETEASIIQLVQ